MWLGVGGITSVDDTLVRAVCQHVQEAMDRHAEASRDPLFLGKADYLWAPTKLSPDKPVPNTTGQQPPQMNIDVDVVRQRVDAAKR